MNKDELLRKAVHVLGDIAKCDAVAKDPMLAIEVERTMALIEQRLGQAESQELEKSAPTAEEYQALKTVRCEGQRRIEKARDAAQEKRASEPSQVAKQAAEWRFVGSGFTCILVDENNRTIATNLDEGSGKFICDAHNTATAKAWELLEETRRERDVANEDYHRLQIDHDKLWDEAAKAREELEQLRTASFHDVSESIARMVIEYVEGGIKLGTDWRNGLADVIALRLKRVQMDKDKQLAHQQPSVIRRNPNEDHRAAQQPSAPTAEEYNVRRSDDLSARRESRRLRCLVSSPYLP